MLGWFSKWWSMHLVFISLVAAGETIFIEDFEDVDITYTVSQPDDLTAKSHYDYYGRMDANNLPSNLNYNNFQGNGFYGAQDINYSDSNIEQIKLIWSNIAIGQYQDLVLSWYVAEDAAEDGSQDWDSTSSFRIETQINNSAVETIFAIEAQHSSGDLYNHAPRIDSDFDGIGDGMLIDNTFSYHERSIEDGDWLTIHVIIEKLNDGDEDIAFDQLKLTGSFVPEPAQYPLITAYAIVLICLLRRQACLMHLAAIDLLRQ
jgi:hypothetical protein